MSLARLIIREILFRKLNFLLATASVATAVGCLLVQTTALRRHDLQTERLIAAK